MTPDGPAAGGPAPDPSAPTPDPFGCSPFHSAFPPDGWAPTGPCGPPGAEQPPAAAELPSDHEQAILAGLEALRNPKSSWLTALAILVVSAVAFVLLGVFKNPALDLVALVGVLLFHELGHLLGMLAFGYRNVRMFFIPLLGAAVSGQKTTAEGYKEAIVTLSGPLPGICLGLALVPLHALLPSEVLFRLSVLLLALNGFNLIPIFPLDGGRFLNEVLFSRNRYLESLVQLLAALGLALLGYGLDAKLFYFLAVVVLVGIRPAFLMNTIARQVRSQLDGPLPPVADPIPLSILRAILVHVRARLPSVSNAKSLAGMIHRIWEKMHARPPGVLATLGLLLVYLAGLGAIVVGAMAWAVMLALSR